MKKPATRVDSITLNKTLPLYSQHTDSASLISAYSNKLTAKFIHLTNSDTDTHQRTDTISHHLEKVSSIVKPKAQKIEPFVAPVNHPKPVKAGELRSTGLSNQNIMYLSEEQGLPSSNIRNVMEDQTGALWIGHSSGLTRYDGYNFYTYTVRSGLPSNSISKIVKDKNNYLWIGTNNGLVKYDGIEFLIYNKECGLPGNNISDVTLDNTGAVWFVCQEIGVCKLKADSIKIFTNESGFVFDASYVIGVDSKNRVVIGNWGGWPTILENEKTVIKFKDGKSDRFIVGSPMNFGFGSDVTTAVYADKNKRIWLGTYNGGVVNYNDTGSAHYRPYTSFPYFLFHSILEDSDHKMWFGSGEGGAARMDKNGYRIYTTKQGLTSNKITCIYEDSGKNIWIGTQDGGLNRIKPASFRNYSSLDGLSDKSVVSLALNRKNNVLIGTWGGGLFEFDGKKFLHYSDKRGLDWKIILSMAEDKKGNLFVGSHQHGLDMLTPRFNDSLTYDTSYHLSATKNMGCRFAKGILPDKDGNVWIGDINEAGLTRYNYNSFDKYTVKSGLASNAIYTIRQDRKGNIWMINGQAGISKIRGNTIEHFAKANGLPSNEATSIYVDKNDHLWIGTGYGVCKYDGKKFVTIDYKDGLSSNFIASIIEDHKKRIWISTNRGLNILTPDSSKPKGYSIENFFLQDGLKSNSFSQEAVVMDTNNTIWWGTSKGVVKLDLKEFDTQRLSPPCRISQVSLMDEYINFRGLLDSTKKDANYYSSDSTFLFNRVNFTSVTPYSNLPIELKLPYNINSLVFYFYALKGNSPHRIKYRYRLVGESDSWANVNYPEAKYSNLDAGNYTFEAQAKIEGEPWGEMCSYSFEIKPPFWETWWFRALGLGAILYSIILVFRFRNKQLLERQQQLETTVKERTSEIEHQKHLIEEKQKEIVDSINYAKRIQYALLAHEDILKQNLSDYFVFFNPKDIVSGDFYWSTQKDDRFYLAVCDSTGHGVPGAFMSLLNIGFLTEAITEKGIEKPNEVFDYVRQKLTDSISKEGQKDGFDGILICINRKTNKLSYASANNNPVFVSNSLLDEKPGDRMPVGVGINKDNFKLFEIDIRSEDILYLYTDGFADQFGGPKGKKFKYGQLNQLLLDISQKQLSVQKQILQDTFNNWKGALEQVDDVCVIGLRV